MGCSTIEYLLLNLKKYNTRIAQYNKKDHIVVPVTMLTEGVHFGSGGPIFYPAEEISKFPAAWNGRPVPIYHPEENGFPVSANSPSVLDNNNVGYVFGAKVVDGGKKLTAELWLDIERLAEHDADLLKKINAKEEIEVSTGLFLELDGTPGEWNGEQYMGKATNFRPDHLAILPTGTGACSVKDGCGIRANSKNEYQQLWNRLVTLEKLAYEQVSGMIQAALRVMNRENVWHWLEQTWSDYFIYSVENEKGVEHYKQKYKLSDDKTTVEFNEAPVKVKKEWKYTVINQKGEQEMKKREEKIKFLNDNGVAFDVKDTTTPDSVIDNLVKLAQDSLNALQQMTEMEGVTNGLREEIKGLKEQTTKTQIKVNTVDEYIAQAPEEIRNVLFRALVNDRKKKDELVAYLAANQKVFTADELKAKSIDELEKIRLLSAKTTVENGVQQGNYILSNSQTMQQHTETPMETPTFNFSKK